MKLLRIILFVFLQLFFCHTSQADWQSGQAIDKLTDETTHLVYTPGDTKARYGRSITLVLICIKNEWTNVLIDWKTYIGSPSEFIYPSARFDKGQISMWPWIVSNDGKSTIWNKNISGDLFGQLLAAKQFVIEVEPYQSTPLTVEFDLSGLDAALKKIKECALPADLK